MAINKESKGTEKAAYKPVIIADHKEYIKLSEPKGKGFDNTSKSINELNSAGSPSVADHYVPEFLKQA